MKLSILFVGVFLAICRGQERIAGGQETSVSAFPFAAALLTNSGAGTTFTFACGGTIISRNAILSAASCFFTGPNVNPPGWWRARTGSAQRNGGGVIHIINRITPHPNFDQSTLDINLAVIRTRFDIDLVPGQVEQAYLPGAAFQFTNNHVVHAIGWGADATGTPSDQLRSTQIWTVAQQTCASRYAAANVQVTDNMVCAGWLDVGVRGQCEGDVGSPLLDNKVVLGVFSHGIGCADYWFPGINTRVAPYSRWIVATAIE